MGRMQATTRTVVPSFFIATLTGPLPKIALTTLPRYLRSRFFILLTLTPSNTSLPWSYLAHFLAVPSRRTINSHATMPFTTGHPGRVFGEGVFENDAALRAVDCLNEIAGLDKLKPAATDTGDKITYSLYAAQCSDPEAAEQVRKHLDSGVLHKLTAKMVANYFNPLSVDDYTCHGYVPIVLGACAMSHGCNTLYTAPGYHVYFKTYKEMLIGIFETAPLMDAAKEQMKKALLCPVGFKPGTAIDFNHFARPASYSPNPNDPCITLMLGGIPAGYQPKYQSAAKGGFGVIGPCSKGDMEYSSDKKVCGGCNISHDKPLVCARCKDQAYCSKACQRKDFRRHKAVCRTPEDSKQMQEQRDMWMNTFDIPGHPLTGMPEFNAMSSVAKEAGVPFEAVMCALARRG